MSINTTSVDQLFNKLLDVLGVSEFATKVTITKTFGNGESPLMIEVTSRPPVLVGQQVADELLTETKRFKLVEL